MKLRSFTDLMGIDPTTGFDPTHRFVTSWLIPPTILASLRLLISIYGFTTIFAVWGYEASTQNAIAIGQEFSYFTDITWWGISFYMLVSAVHGFVYVKNGTSWLHYSSSKGVRDGWVKRMCQVLHSLFYTTIVVFPFLVTIVYWWILFRARVWTLGYFAWSNISKHALNSFFALLEIFLPSTNPMPWFHLLFVAIILACYLAVAYITYYAQGWLPYSFLNPRNPVQMVGYVFGILVATAILFAIVWVLIWFRLKVTGARQKRSPRDIGSRMGSDGVVQPVGAGDVEMTAK